MIRIAMWSGPRNISTAMMRSFENRDDTDPDVVAYIQPIKTRWVKVGMPDSAKHVANQLRNLQDYLCGKLYKQGFLERPRKISTTMLLNSATEQSCST